MIESLDGKVILIGHSTGGFLGVRAAGRWDKVITIALPPDGTDTVPMLKHWQMPLKGIDHVRAPELPEVWEVQS